MSVGGTPVLQHSTAVVTGASRGIGRAVAIALAAAGAQVILLARSTAQLERVASEIGGKATALACDVTSAMDLARVVDVVGHRTTLGALMLVNNAGLFSIGAIERTDPALFEATIQANLVAPFRFLHAFVPGMRAAGMGHVVTIGSVADRAVFSGNGAYSAGKFGARALHEVLREELRGSGVRSTLISPAATDTPIWDPLDPDNTPGFPSRASMLRPEDVAEAVLWALSRPAHVNVDELRLSRS